MNGIVTLEIALKLKEMGFPQGYLEDFYVIRDGTLNHGKTDLPEDMVVSAPTYSVLWIWMATMKGIRLADELFNKLNKNEIVDVLTASVDADVFSEEVRKEFEEIFL